MVGRRSTETGLTLGRRLLFSGVIFTGVFGLSELLARLLPAETTRSRERLILDHARSEGLLSPNLDVPGWDLVEDGVQNGIPYQLNRWRMRGPDHPEEKGPGVERVIFVGDSSVFGVQLEWRDTFSARFAQRREHRLPQVDYQVANCASPGHSSYQSRIKLERHCLDFEPDVVVIANQFSDSTLERLEDRERFPEEAHPELIRALEVSALFRLSNLLWWERVGAKVHDPTVIQQVGMEQSGKTARVDLTDYAENLTAMVSMVREAGGVPVLMVLAAMADTRVHQVGDKVVSREYREIMRRVAQTSGVQLVDLGEVVRTRHRDRTQLFLDQVHPSREGAQLYAQVLDASLPAPDQTP